MKLESFKQYVYFLSGAISSALILGWLMSEPKVWLFILGTFLGFLLILGLEVIANMIADWIRNDT